MNTDAVSAAFAPPRPAWGSLLWMVSFTVAWTWRMTTVGPAHEPDGSISDEARSRLKVAVSIFGRATPVELEFGQVEKL